VIPQPVDRVWDVLRPLDLTFLKDVASSELEGGVSAAKVGGVRRVTYRDGTVQRVALRELSDASSSVTYEVVESIPPVSYLSVVHTVTLRRITSVGQSFVEFTSDYSNDAKSEVLADSKYKKVDFIQQLAKASESRAAKFFRQLNIAKLDRLTETQIDAA